jgi:hypothetical protein
MSREIIGNRMFNNIEYLNHNPRDSGVLKRPGRQRFLLMIVVALSVSILANEAAKSRWTILIIIVKNDKKS